MNSVSSPLTAIKCVTCIYKRAWFCFLCFTLICDFNAAAIISVRICKLRRLTDHFKHFHYPTFTEKWTFFLHMLLEPCFSSQSCTDSFLCSSVLPSTQHKYCTYKYRCIQNSLTLSIPLPLPSLLCTHTHAHEVFCNLHALIWGNHTSEKGEGWIRLLWITVAWKAYR